MINKTDKIENRKIGYVRVSSQEQNIDRQIRKLATVGITDTRDIYIDKKSGKDFDRVAYQYMKQSLRRGDEVYVVAMDRLGRNKEEIKKELQYFKDNNIIIRIMDIPTTLMDLNQFGEGMAAAFMDMINNLLIEVLGTIAEEERKKIKERQAEGIAAARERGQHLGRPIVHEKDEVFINEYNKWKAGKQTATAAYKALNMGRTTFYRKVKEYEKGQK